MTTSAFTLVMMPPHTPVRRDWAARVAEEEVGVRVLQPETMAEAVRDIADADAAFGTIPPEVLAAAAACAGCRPLRSLHLQAFTIPS